MVGHQILFDSPSCHNICHDFIECSIEAKRPTLRRQCSPLPASPGPHLHFSSFLHNRRHTSCTLAHFLHTCTCDAQGWTLVGRQAQFWFGAAAVAVNSQWQWQYTHSGSILSRQTLRAKLYKSPSIPTARAHGTPCLQLSMLNLIALSAQGARFTPHPELRVDKDLFDRVNSNNNQCKTPTTPCAITSFHRSNQ